ncbi:MAG: hypothetical protein Ct9H300mP16_10260 [Pseudomonadota bacterium]|nr:MAG: hypothetical protein Ct9H300mP16_10260 [Pseudomonadota bacterium]
MKNLGFIGLGMMGKPMARKTRSKQDTGHGARSEQSGCR